jgi:hypothetical protein
MCQRPVVFLVSLSLFGRVLLGEAPSFLVVRLEAVVVEHPLDDAGHCWRVRSKGSPDRAGAHGIFGIEEDVSDPVQNFVPIVTNRFGLRLLLWLAPFLSVGFLNLWPRLLRDGLRSGQFRCYGLRVLLKVPFATVSQAKSKSSMPESKKSFGVGMSLINATSLLCR